MKAEYINGGVKGYVNDPDVQVGRIVVDDDTFVVLRVSKERPFSGVEIALNRSAAKRLGGYLIDLAEKKPRR